MEFFEISKKSAREVPPARRIPAGPWNGLLYGELEEGTVTLVYGREGIGKTTFVLQIASAAASAGPVLYATAETEMTKESVLRMAERTGSGFGAQGVTLSSVDEVLQAATREKSRLVIVDSLPAVAGKAPEQQEGLLRLQRHARTTGAAVIAMARLDTWGRRAGGSNLPYAADMVIHFERLPTKAEIRIVIGGERDPALSSEPNADTTDDARVDDAELRIIEVTKSRSGPLGQVVARMTRSGLKPKYDDIDIAIAKIRPKKARPKKKSSEKDPPPPGSEGSDDGPRASRSDDSMGTGEEEI